MKSTTRRMIDEEASSRTDVFGLASKYFDVGNHYIASKLYLADLLDDPLNRDTIFNLALCYRELDKLDKALFMLKGLIAEDASDSLVWQALGNTYAKAGDRQEAINCFLKGHELQPGNYDLSFNIGISYLKSGDDDSARQWFLKCCEIYPESLEGHLYAEYCGYLLGIDTGAHSRSIIRKVTDRKIRMTLKTRSEALDEFIIYLREK